MSSALSAPTDLSQAARHYFVEHSAALPTLSAQGARVLSLGEKVMQADITELVMLVRSDAVSAAELMRLANTPTYARGRAIRGIDEAIVRLGRREVYNLLSAVTTRSLFEPKLKRLFELMPDQWARMQQHAVVCAFAAGWAANFLRISDYETCFLAGMFHDIGKLGALYCLGSLLVDQGPDHLPDSEKLGQAIESVHTEMGCTMLNNWQMSPDAIAVCRDMHRPSISGTHDKTLHVVRIVSSLNIQRDATFVPPELAAELEASVAALKLDAAKYDQLRKKLGGIVDHVATLLGRSPNQSN